MFWREAVEALVGVAKEASAWLVQNLNGNIPQGMSTPVTIQMMPPESQRLALATLADICTGLESSEFPSAILPSLSRLSLVAA